MTLTEKGPLVGESVQLIGQLMQLQNEVAYVVECLAQDYTAEAKRGVWDVEGYLNKTGLPGYIDAPVRAELAEAEKSVGNANRNIGKCTRHIQGIRCRLSNELAWRTGQPLPYSVEIFPPYSSGYAVVEEKP